MRPILPGWVLLLLVAILVMAGLFWVRANPAGPANPLEEAVKTLSQVLGMVVAETPDAQGGLPIKSVTPGSPAEQFGLRAGDRIMAVDDRSVWHVAQLRDLMAEDLQKGQPFILMVARENAYWTVTFGMGRVGGLPGRRGGSGLRSGR